MSERLRERPIVRSRSVAVAALAALAWLASCSGPGPSPSALTDVSATPVPGGVLVEWAGGDGATAFVVHRAADGEELAQLAEVPGDVRAYADYAVEPGTSYAYAVSAVGASGAADPVLQSAAPVEPLPGVRLSIELDGDGTVVVEGAAAPVACRDDCVVGVEPGSQLVLSGVGGAAAFAGFTSPCPPSPTCQLEVDRDMRVRALFRSHVLRLSLDGDAPVEASVSPPDDRGRDGCALESGTDCLLGYTYTAGGPLKVSVNATLADASDAQLVGMAGGCTASQGFCVVDVQGATEVAVRAARRPVAVPDAFTVRADGRHTVEAPGVLANDEFGQVAEAELVEFGGPGELELGADGSFVYTPGPGTGGSVTFSYRVRGTHGVAGPSATVTLTTVAPPEASDDDYLVLEDRELSVPPPGVLGNDRVSDGTTAELVSFDGPGDLDLDPDGSFTYRPARDDVGTVTFTYRALGELGMTSEPATVTVTILPVNDAPSFDLREERVTARRGERYTLPGFATNISRGGGEDEAGQSLSFLVTWSSGDWLNLADQPFISTDGTLTFATRGFVGYRTGTAVYRVVLIDDGGAANGGANVSEERYLTIQTKPGGGPGGDDDDDDDDDDGDDDDHDDVGAP